MLPFAGYPRTLVSTSNTRDFSRGRRSNRGGIAHQARSGPIKPSPWARARRSARRPSRDGGTQTSP